MKQEEKSKLIKAINEDSEFRHNLQNALKIQWISEK